MTFGAHLLPLLLFPLLLPPPLPLLLVALLRCQLLKRGVLAGLGQMSSIPKNTIKSIYVIYVICCEKADIHKMYRQNSSESETVTGLLLKGGAEAC